MTPHEESEEVSDAKALSMAALWVLGHVERGQASTRSLRRYIDADVIQAVRATTGPRKPGPVAPVQVAVPSARVTTDRLRAHAVGLARRPDGSLSAYVVELGRVSVLRCWMVSELTSVEDQRLLGNRPLEFDRDLPADLTCLIVAAVRQRDLTTSELRAAHQRWRDAGRDLRRLHKPEVERCQAAAERAEEELAAYTETQRFRQGRDRLLEHTGEAQERYADWDSGR